MALYASKSKGKTIKKTKIGKIDNMLSLIIPKYQSV